MAILKVPKKEIEKYIKLTEENINKINLMGIPIESVKENEVEFEVLPNRPDCLSVQGYLRMLKAYLGKEPGLKEYKLHKPEKDFRVKIDSSVKNIRPYTACAIVKDLNFNDEKIKEIIDIQEKLHTTVGRNRKKLAIGIYPLEKIKLPIKYEARKPKDIKFIPLESDREMTGLEILQRHPTGRDYAKLLENYEKFPVFVDADNKILSMPPIINSHETGKISESTKEVFIECSGFDFSSLKKVLNIIVTTLADMGGKIYQMELDYGNKEITPNLTPEKMKLSLENANKLIGLELKEKDLEKLLPKMGYNYSAGKVEIPAWRTDILHEVDIIEDIAIAYGYENLIPEIPKVSTIGEESKESKTIRTISDILIGLGLLETSSYHLIKPEEIKSIKESERIELENSKTEYKFLRPNLLIPSLRILSENKDNEYPQRTFEIGTVFSLNEKEETGIKETTNLIISICPGNLTEIQQILDNLMRMLNKKYSLSESSKLEFIEGRCASIIIDNQTIGHFGEVHPKVLQESNIKMPLAYLEINIEKLIMKN